MEKVNTKPGTLVAVCYEGKRNLRPSRGSKFLAVILLFPHTFPPRSI